MDTSNQLNQSIQSIEPDAVKTSEVEKVKFLFLAEIEKNGIDRVFKCMSNWFYILACAQVIDEINEQVHGYADKKTATNLCLSGMVSQMACAIDCQSTMESTNIMRRARLSAASKMLQRGTGYGSNHDRSNAWSALINAQSSQREG